MYTTVETKITWVLVRLAPTCAVGMPCNFGPVRVLKRFSRPLEIRIPKPTGRTPSVPLNAREGFAVRSYHLTPALSCHKPLIPIWLRLFEARRWQITWLPANRNRHQPPHAVRNNYGQHVGGTRAPVMADNRECFQIKCIGKIDGVLCHRDHLTGTLSVLRQKRSITEAAQIRHDSAKSCRVQSWHDAIIGADVVRPTMQEQHWIPVDRASSFKSNIQRWSGSERHASKTLGASCSFPRRS